MNVIKFWKIYRKIQLNCVEICEYIQTLFFDGTFGMVLGITI